MHIDRAGQDHEPGAVDRLGGRAGSAGDQAIFDPEVKHTPPGDADVPEDQV